jgi:hypothetical protein
MDDKKVKVYDFIKSNLLNFVVILIAISYVFYNMVIIERTDLTIGECIAEAGIGVFVAFAIKEALGENGFNRGYQSQIWQNNLQKYNNACNLANEYIDRVDNFYEVEEAEKKKKYRQQNLQAIRLKYSDYFDSEGNYIDLPIKPLKSLKNGKIQGVRYLSRYQQKILKKCVKVKIHNLNLFSEYGNEIENDTHPEKTDNKQRVGMLKKNILAIFTTSIIGAYFLPRFESWNWGSFVSSCVQVALWVGLGVIQLYQNYNYVVIEKTNKLTRKMELIIKFTRGCEKGLYQKGGNDYGEQEKVCNTNGDIPIICDDTTNNIHIDKV